MDKEIEEEIIVAIGLTLLLQNRESSSLYGSISYAPLIEPSEEYEFLEDE